MSQDDPGSPNGRRRPNPPPRDPQQRARYEAEEAYRKRQREFEQEEGPADELRQMGLKLLRRAFAEQAHVRHAVSDYGADLQRRFLLRALDGDEERYRMVVERMERSNALSKEHMRKAAALRMDYLSNLLDVQRGWVDGLIDRWRNRSESDNRSARFVERLVGLGDEDIQHATIKSVVLVEMVKDMLKGQDPYFEKLTEEERQHLLEFTLGMRDTPPDIMATLFKDVDVRRPRGVPKRQPQGNQLVEAQFGVTDLASLFEFTQLRVAGTAEEVEKARETLRSVRRDKIEAEAASANANAKAAASAGTDAAAADTSAASIAAVAATKAARAEVRAIEASSTTVSAAMQAESDRDTVAEVGQNCSEILDGKALRPWFLVDRYGSLRYSHPAFTRSQEEPVSFITGMFSFDDDNLEDREFTYFIGPCISEPPLDWTASAAEVPWPDSRFSAAEVVKVAEKRDDPALVRQEQTDDSPPKLKALEMVQRTVHILFQDAWFHAHALELRNGRHPPPVRDWFDDHGWTPEWSSDQIDSRPVILPYRVQVSLPDLRRSVMVRFMVLWLTPPEVRADAITNEAPERS